MKLLLTSAGIKNPSIRDALVDLLGKPIADSSALCIPTASYGHPGVRPEGTWAFISGREPRTPMTELGWKSLGVLELTALPSIDRERWVSWVHETDVLLVNGGDALYLCLLDARVRTGGSPALAARDGLGGAERREHGDDPAHRRGLRQLEAARAEATRRWGSSTSRSSRTSINPDLPENTMAAAEKWAAEIGGPAYAIDDETAIKVTEGTVEVVSEGHWKLFTP